MTIHIKEPYKAQRELSLTEVNCLLAAGLIDSETVAWIPGLENWVPIYEIPGIEMPAPPPLPSSDRTITPDAHIPAEAPKPAPPIHPVFAYFLPIGRIGRGAWFLRNIFHVLALGILAAPFADSETTFANFVAIFICFSWIYLIIITAAKRFHDLNVTAWLSPIVFIPLVPLFLLILSGTKGANNYGSDTSNSSAEKYSFNATRILVLALCLIVLAILASLVVPACSSAIKKGSKASQKQWAPPPKDLVESTAPRIPESNSLDTKAIYETVAPRIVKVEALNEIGHPIMHGSGVALGPSLSELKSTSLAYLDSGTDIVTNFHVIEDAEFIIVETKAGTVQAANVVYFDRRRDLAVIRIPASIATTEIGISSSPEIADKVVAIGNPQGMDWTISEGIVSRTPDLEHGVLQTTAAISGGSSGGGLFDVSGNLIGITFGSLKNSQNMNFAISLHDELNHDITKSRKGSAISPQAIWKSDFVVGFYQWDPNYFLNPKWEETYRKKSIFADYIKLKDEIQAEWLKLYERRKLNRDLHYLSGKGLRELAPQLTLLIERQYELFSDDPDVCLGYLDLVEDDAKKEALLIEWLKRWPTSLDVFQKAGIFFIEQGKSKTTLKLFAAMKGILSEPSAPRTMSNERSQLGYDSFMTSAALKKKEKERGFNIQVNFFRKIYGLDCSEYLFESSDSEAPPNT